MTSAISTERIDNVVVIHMDDGKANALSFAMLAAISAAVDAAVADATVGAIVLHGRPGKFCAGFDLSVMGSGDFNAVANLMCDGGDLVHKLYGVPIPVVAASTGHALAAGALMLLACDLRVGADVPCKIGLNEVAIGIVLPDWAITICDDRLSRRHLQTAVALAELTGAAGAVDAGFLDVVVPEADVLSTAVAKAQVYAGFSRDAYGGTVRAMRSGVLARMAELVARDRPK
ncbi:MAG: crotonase/enoyl-CoA hydratase family protein [Actinomycetota bacterium]|nr:crotonase/enoyl-CoA hydratase family protein [Actinomycetota bacterium]